MKEKVARAIRQLKKGKTEYFDEIYDLTRASVYYVIRGVLKDNYLVEDAMQETYVAFLNSIAKIDDEQNPLSYLLQIAKNKALDEARRKTRAAGANIDDVEIATSDVTVSDLPLLEHARQNLSDDEFRILELTTIYGYRRVEVAKMLGEPISTPGKSPKTPGVSYASDYVVFIDVNPSVRLDVSGGDVVTAQKGMNKDGVVLLYQENLVGKNIDEAATYLIEKMDEAGLVKDKGKVRISVADKKTGKRIDEKQRHAVDVVNNLFKNKNKDVSAMILSDNDIDAIEDYYDNNNVGEYEKQMVEEFKAKLLLAIDKKIGRIDELLNILKPWEKDERKVKNLDQNDAEKAALEAIKVYCADYKVNYHEVGNDEIAEFCEELFDKKKDLLECIDDINNPDGDDSYGEILSDLLEIVKEELFEQED